MGAIDPEHLVNRQFSQSTNSETKRETDSDVNSVDVLWIAIKRVYLFRNVPVSNIVE